MGSYERPNFFRNLLIHKPADAVRNRESVSLVSGWMVFKNRTASAGLCMRTIRPRLFDDLTPRPASSSLDGDRPSESWLGVPIRCHDTTWGEDGPKRFLKSGMTAHDCLRFWPPGRLRRSG